jgi:hypothetical protein
MHQHAPGPRPVRQLDLELVVRHLAYQTDRRFEHVVVPGLQLGRRQSWARLLVEAQEFDDIANDLRKDKAIAARHHRNRARTQPPQLL